MGVLAGERTLAGERLVEAAAERPHVGARIGGQPAGLLGTHVRRGAEQRPRARRLGGQGGGVREVTERAGGGAAATRLRSLLVGHRLGETEVEDLDPAVVRELDVGRLEIAMQDPLLVRRLESLGDLEEQRQRLLDRDRTARDARRQVLALDQLHDEEAAVAVAPRSRGASRRWDG